MKLYNLDSELTFGKYKGETVIEILKKDSSYITSFCLKQQEDFYITDEVYEASIIYGFKGSIDGSIEKGQSIEKAIEICKDADPNKQIFEEKRQFFKDHLMEQFSQKLESELSGNNNIVIEDSIF